MAFLEGSIKQEKVHGGLVFPKTLLPPTTLENPTTDDLVELVKKERDWISASMNTHGAVLFRGFGLQTAEDFARVVEATEWEEFRYTGPVDRRNPTDRVFTANESPLHFQIGFHHEMALINSYPAKLFFFCVQPSPEGGETSIVRSDVVVERMEEKMPEVVGRLERDGFCCTLHRASDTWQRLLKTTDQTEAEKTALETLYGCKSVEFNEDGSADFHYGPISPIREVDGRRVWFNTIVGFVTEQAELNATYGVSGEVIPSDVLEGFHEVLGENCVDLPWEKGDVVIINNHLVQHARRPGKPPRVILVSLCKL